MVLNLLSGTHRLNQSIGLAEPMGAHIKIMVGHNCPLRNSYLGPQNNLFIILILIICLQGHSYYQ